MVNILILESSIYTLVILLIDVFHEFLISCQGLCEMNQKYIKQCLTLK